MEMQGLGAGWLRGHGLGAMGLDQTGSRVVNGTVINLSQLPPSNSTAAREPLDALHEAAVAVVDRALVAHHDGGAGQDRQGLAMELLVV
jgi:hypothetical protein